MKYKTIYAWDHIQKGMKLRCTDNSDQVEGVVTEKFMEFFLLDDGGPYNDIPFSKQDFYGSGVFEEIVDEDAEEVAPVKMEYKIEEVDLGNRRVKHQAAGHTIVSQYVLKNGQKLDFFVCRTCKLEVE